MFVIQPPVDIWWAAWLAPLPWLSVIRLKELGSKHPWHILWCAGFLHWLLAIHWLRLPHPATSIGWIVLSAYLAFYVPLFIWIARFFVHKKNISLMLAAPLAWVTCEQIRSTLLGGFTFASLGHSQWRWTLLIQSADLFSTVGISALIMLVAASLVSQSIKKMVIAASIFGLLLIYGGWRIVEEPEPMSEPLDVLLVQGSIDTELKHQRGSEADVTRHYDELTIQGLENVSGVLPDLIVWPETMWRWSLLDIDPREILPESVVEQFVGPSDETTKISGVDRQRECREILEQERLQALAVYARRYGTNWLVGVDKQEISPIFPSGTRNFNCGLFLDPDGKVRDCYEKMYPVMFGEYIPLANYFPWLYSLTPLPTGLTAGSEPVVVPIKDFQVTVNICYETALPGAVRQLVQFLQNKHTKPDVLVNLTNDGWFWGSSELDMHLASAVFRAVEVRTPVVIAANTGFSAWIDGSGRLLARGPRRSTGTIRALVQPDGRQSLWLFWGNLPAWGCVAVTGCIIGRGRWWNTKAGGCQI